MRRHDLLGRRAHRLNEYLGGFGIHIGASGNCNWRWLGWAVNVGANDGVCELGWMAQRACAPVASRDPATKAVANTVIVLRAVMNVPFEGQSRQ
jgi:hypothetical protein